MNIDDESDEDMQFTPPPQSHYYSADQSLIFQPLTHERERELFVKSGKGDESAREFLITNHLLFAMTFARKHGRGLPEDDLVSSANLALMMAIDRFDPTRANRFTSFLKPFIRGEIARLWRSKNVVGSPRHTIPPTTVSIEDLATGNNRTDFTDNESDFGQLLRKAMDLSDVVHEFSFRAIDEAAQLTQIWEVAEKVLTEYEFKIFKAVYRDGMTWAEYARKRGVSRKAVWSAHGRGMQKVLKELRIRKAI